MFYNIGFTYTMVIYCRSMVITTVIRLYNTEWQYYQEIAVKYGGKKFYKIVTWSSFSLMTMDGSSSGEVKNPPETESQNSRICSSWAKFYKTFTAVTYECL
jgi:hypothetical protein